MNFRRHHGLPAFTSLANVIVRETNLEKAIGWSRQLSEYFSPHNGKGVRILGPATAPLARLKKRISLSIFAEIAEAFSTD